MAFENYYAGDCASCGTHVAKRAGVYYYGHTFCSEPQLLENPLTQVVEELCASRYASRAAYYESDEFKAALVQRDADRAVEVERYRLLHIELINERFVELNMRPATLTKLVVKAAGSEVALDDLTWSQAAEISNELLARIDRKAAKGKLDYFKANNMCPRCGGLGYADKWTFTGKVCFRCNGDGKYN